MGFWSPTMMWVRWYMVYPRHGYVVQTVVLGSSHLGRSRETENVTPPLLEVGLWARLWVTISHSPRGWPLVIKDVSTNSGNTRVKKDLQLTRRDKILDKSSRAQSEDLNGNIVSGGKDHLGSIGDTYDRHRRDAVNAFFNLAMAKHIERKLPPQVLASRGGFALGSIRLSFTDMTHTCNKFTPTFMFGTREADKLLLPSTMFTIPMIRRWRGSRLAF